MKHLYITSDWLNGLLCAFKDLGLDITVLTENLAGFKQGKLIDGRRLALSSARLIWHRAVELAQDPLLGVKIGLMQDYRSIGVLAPIFWHSPSVNILLSNLVRYQQLISENGVYSIHSTLVNNKQKAVNSRCFDVEYLPADNLIPVNLQQVLSVITATINMVKAITHDRIKVLKLTLPPVLNAKLVSAFLGCEVTSKEGNAIMHCSMNDSMEQFQEMTSGCDQHLYQINTAYADELLKEKCAGITLIKLVENHIIKQGFVNANIDHLQAGLGINKRTLQRELSELGTSFKILKEEVIKAHVINALRQNKQGIEAISVDLGYSEPSAFYRAFKGWFGLTPKQYIK